MRRLIAIGAGCFLLAAVLPCGLAGAMKRCQKPCHDMAQPAEGDACDLHAGHAVSASLAAPAPADLQVCCSDCATSDLAAFAVNLAPPDVGASPQALAPAGGIPSGERSNELAGFARLLLPPPRCSSPAKA